MGLSFTPLPRYQFFLIAEYIEVTFATFPHTQDLLMLFTPAWHHAAKFLQQLPALVSALHEVDNKTLANNLAAIANQVLFSAILNPALPKDTRLQAQNVLCELSAASISTTSTSTRLLFIQRFSPAVFKFVDTLCTKSDQLSFDATRDFIAWFACYISNTDFFWPWAKWYACCAASTVGRTWRSSRRPRRTA